MSPLGESRLAVPFWSRRSRSASLPGPLILRNWFLGVFSSKSERRLRRYVSHASYKVPLSIVTLIHHRNSTILLDFGYTLVQAKKRTWPLVEIETPSSVWPQLIEFSRDLWAPPKSPGFPQVHKGRNRREAVSWCHQIRYVPSSPEWEEQLYANIGKGIVS
ncbi:hypothetical protein GMOD_00000067 [Pyrenophora seminiperda CCB06]|uniref:Uncharacterized protein n=1 Tax=Pyrenophora seminiperda CCB06 TaxID=1302712 RepID=A0A3M7M6C2_9PLEO|nr:hypothetical protein GMOD_00000067 [Pyrenophora seminiperda CCB06]